MGRKRKRNYKPLLFTTTIRNPQRIKSLLLLFSKFNGQKLTNELAVDVMAELIKFGIYRPRNIIDSVKEKWSGTKSGEFGGRILSDEETKKLLELNPQNHKEAGFEKGWASRFATVFDFSKELGFVYYEINEEIVFSSIGLRLANSIELVIDEDGQIFYEEVHPEFEQLAFLHSLTKYQRNNPFVNVLNDNVPLILLLQVISLLNEYEKTSKGISKLEIPLLLFWKDNNAEKLFQKIVELRNKYGSNPSWETVFEICKNEIMEGKDVKRDIKSIMQDYTDEFIRKMRLTGLISLRGGGRYIDLNYNEIEKIEYILKNYASYPKFENGRDYFDYMAKVDERLLSVSPEIIDAKEKEKMLLNWVNYFNWPQIKGELLLLQKKKESKDAILKYFSHPVRLEFLIAIAIKKRFNKVRVLPNYPCDDEGLPTSTAAGSGDKGDIECFEEDNGILIEVTMSNGRNQTVLEVWPIVRHLEKFSGKVIGNTMCHFIAPAIFIDSKRQIEYVREKENWNISPRDISEFISYLENSKMLYETIN